MPTRVRSPRTAPLLLLGLLLAWLPAPLATLAQPFYPVHATVRLLPPLGPYLSDLGGGRREPGGTTLPHPRP